MPIFLLPDKPGQAQKIQTLSESGAMLRQRHNAEDIAVPLEVQGNWEFN